MLISSDILILAFMCREPLLLNQVIMSFFILVNVHLVEAMVFPVVMYGCERWTVKKAER